MKRILFLVLCVLSVLTAPEAQALEIYAHGHKYDSLEAYLASKRPVAVKDAPQATQKGLSDVSLHKLYVMSVENGVVGALQDFYAARGQPDFPMPHAISSEQLQGAIQQAVTTSKDPKLLISQPGKVRIVALTAVDPGK